VLVLPPWEVIYVNDAERDQSFAEAVDVHAKIVRWYGSCVARSRGERRLTRNR